MSEVPLDNRVNYFSALPATWGARQQGISLSPSRKGAGADWIYYDPRDLGGEGARCSADHAKAESRVSRDMPDGHPMGWHFSAMTDGWQPEENKGDADDGWLDDYSEDGSLPSAEPMSHRNNHGGVDNRRGSQAMPASVVPTASGVSVVDEMAALRRVLLRIGGVPEFVVAGSEETILDCLLYTSPSPRDQRGSRMPSSA